MKQNKHIQKLIRVALKEDIGSGDVTTRILIKRNRYTEGYIVAREKGILCGVDIVKTVFKLIDRTVKVKILKCDGATVTNGDSIIRLRGSSYSILKGERVALNFISRLSGISTATHAFVKKVRGTKAHIYDTRKTTPGYRILEKYAVRTGGGCNHRMGLYDQVLIKDNHFKILDKKTIGNFHALIAHMRKKIPRGMKIEIEADNLTLLKKIVPAHPDVILLDNMNKEKLKKALTMIQNENKKAKVKIVSEGSGRITLANVLTIAKMGVDRISIGTITHSATSLDFSLELV